MSANRRRPRSIRGSRGSVTPVQPIVIASVSQIAGTIDGGSVLSVTGSGFQAGMTANLTAGGSFGTVSAITGTTCTITTAAHSVGAATWILKRTATDGQQTADQTFTFVAHGTAPSLSPNNGPQTLTTAGVIFTVATGLPPLSSGCPIMATVDGNAVTSIAQTGATTFTGTVPTDTTSGAKNVVVTVDGVAGATGTGAWTYIAPPAVSSATIVAATGGTGSITGTAFVNGATASVNINGTPTALTIAFVNSTTLNYTLAGGSYTTGTWPITVTNPDTQTGSATVFEIDTAFVITAVSQTAGKAAGGTLITVTASGITGTPTSTLGAVSAITGTTFKITTNAHAAGGFTWTATDGNGLVSANQTFTYLASPTFTSVSPNNGPQTLTTSGVTFTGTGYPASGTGCPVTATVDGNSCTSVALNNSTTFTATVPTDTTSGAKNIAVTVDGVSASGGTSAWTYNPPPVDISATNVSTTGGTGTITGANFVNGCTASVNINGTPTSLTIVFVNSTKLTFTLANGSYTASTGSGWPLTITNPDTQVDTESIFVITSISDPQTTLGANLFAWWRSDSGITQSGGLVSQWNDNTSNAINLTATTTARPTYNASSANFGTNNPPSLTFDGSANQLQNNAAAVALGSNVAFLYCIYRYVATGASKYVFGVNQVGQTMSILSDASTQNGAIITNAGGATVNTSPAPATTAAAGIYAYSNGTGASAETLAVSIANMSEGTASCTAAQFSSILGISICLGAKVGASTNFANIELVEAFIANVKPTTNQLNALYAYVNDRYKTDITLGYTRDTNVFATTGNFARFAGAGFNATTTVQLVISGTPTSVSTVYNNAGAVGITGLAALNAGAGLAAGQYDAIFTNGNSGMTLSVSKALTSTATKHPATILGRKLCGWARADNVTLNSTTISAWVDLACLGNVLQQGTGANQPTYVAANASFSNQPTATFTGTPVFMNTAATVIKDSGNGKTYWCLVVFKQSATTGTQTVHGFGTVQIGRDVSGTPSTVWGGANLATWGANIGTALQKTYNAGIYDGSTNTKEIVNVAFGTEVTNTFAGSQTPNSTWQLGANGTPANYLLADVAEIFFCDVEPSAGEKTDLATYVARY